MFLPKIFNSIIKSNILNFKRFTSNIDVHVLPGYKKGLMYLLNDKSTNICAAVDPSNCNQICALVEELGSRLESVITTHHHKHHCNLELNAKFNNLRIFGGDPRVDGVTNILKNNDIFFVGRLQVKSLSTTPFQTKGHMSYFVTSLDKDEPPCCFTGAALYSGGCGNFEGKDTLQVYNSIVGILGKLPDNTKVYFGHELTEDNLKYAIFVEPGNAEIALKLKWAQELRQKGQFTVPTTIEIEKHINPFMRVDLSSVQKHAKHEGNPIATLNYIRREKDEYMR